MPIRIGTIYYHERIFNRNEQIEAIGFTIVAIALAFLAILLARLMKNRSYDQDALVNVVVAKQDVA